MQFTVEFQVSQLRRAEKVISRRIASPRQMLGSIGESLTRVNRARHEKGLAPDGSKWKPLSPMTIGAAVYKKQGESFRKKGTMSLSTARNVMARRRILYGHGDMLGSFNYQVSGDQLTLGFNDPKAKWHHEGTRAYIISPRKAKALAFNGLVRKRVRHPGLPARQLVGFPESDKKLTADVISDHLSLPLQDI